MCGDRLEEMGSCSEEVLVGEKSSLRLVSGLDSLEDVGAIIKVCLGSGLGPFIYSLGWEAGAWDLALALLSGYGPQDMSLPISGLCIPFLKQGVGASDQNFPKSTAGQICTQSVHASFSKEVTSSCLASLKIQLCDVNGISLQKKEMRLASVLPGKES